MRTSIQNSTLAEIKEFLSECERVGLTDDTIVIARVKARLNADGGELTRLTTVDRK